MPPAQQANEDGPANSRFRQAADLFCERAILALVLFIIVWGSLAFAGLPAASFVVIQGATTLALFFWVARVWLQQRQFRLFWTPACWGALIFLLYAVVRCNFVIIPYEGYLELMRVLVYAAIFFLVINNFQRRDSASIIAVALIALGLGMAMFAIFQYATKYPKVWGIMRSAQYMDRGIGTYWSPNECACLFGLTFPLALAYTVMSRFTPTAKVFFGYCALVILASVGVTLSRGGILSGAITLVLFLLFLMFQRGLWLPALAIIVGGAALCAAFGGDLESINKRFDKATNHGQLADSRVGYWSAAIHIFDDHPVWGGGPGHYDQEWLRYRDPWEDHRPAYTHNDYLNTLSDWGATGLAIILATLALLFYGAWKTWPFLSPPDLPPGASIKSNKAAFLIGGCFGLVYILLHSVVDFNMHVPGNAIVVIVLMATVAAQSRFATEVYWKNPRLIGKLLLTAMTIVAAGWLGWQCVPRAQQAYWLEQAEKPTATVEAKLDALQKAHTAEPGDFDTCYSIGEIYRLLSVQADSGEEESDLKQATNWFAKSAADNPLNAVPVMKLALCAQQLGDNQAAEGYLKQACTLDPRNPEMSLQMGLYYMRLRNYSDAVEWLGHSWRLHWNEPAYLGWQAARELLANQPPSQKK